MAENIQKIAIEIALLANLFSQGATILYFDFFNVRTCIAKRDFIIAKFHKQNE